MAALVAGDLVKTLATLDGLGPNHGALQMIEHKSLFAKSLRTELQQAGYTLEQVDYRTGPRYVSYRIDSLQNESGANREYILTVGAVTLKREYGQDDRGVFPVSNVSVDGAIPESPQGDIQQIVQSPEATRRSSPQGSLILASGHTNTTDVTTYAIEDRDPPEDPSNAFVALPEDLSGIPRRNLYETRRSNFADYTTGFAAVDKSILVFPNDSLRITELARQQLIEMSRRFRENTDVISVVGCSHGKTALENGNELLAIGRSKRVQQALVEQGVPFDRILDEGCWAPVHFDEMMPRRGVVLSLKRKSN